MEPALAELTGDIGFEFDKLANTRYGKIVLEYNYDRTMAIVRGDNPPPYEVEIQPSSICDAGCRHCFGRSFKKKPNTLLIRENMKRVIDEVLNFESQGFKIENIKFCGSTGEPLVNEQILYAINEIYGRRKLILFTNGLKLGINKNDDSYLQTIAKVDRVNLSLDAGTTDVLWNLKPGSKKNGIGLEDILEGVRKAKEFSNGRMRLGISYVIGRKNYRDILNFVEKAKNMGGADCVQFRVDMTDPNVSKHHAKEIIGSLEQAKIKYEDECFEIILSHSYDQMESGCTEVFSSRDSGYEKCYLSSFWTCISADGSVYPCGHGAFGDELCYGNILNEPIKKIWDGQRRKEVLKKLPSSQCEVCSPFSLAFNEIGTFLSSISECQVKEMCKDRKILK